jgi:hypothetical protein
MGSEKSYKTWLDKYKWLVNFVSFGDAEQLTYRFVCINRKEYIDYVKSIRIEPDIVTKIRECLPSVKSDVLWLVEISCPQLFAVTRAKFGEMILSLEAHNPDLSRVVEGLPLDLDENALLSSKNDGVLQHLVRLPGIVFLPDSKDDKGGAELETSVIGHTPLWTD